MSAQSISLPTEIRWVGHFLMGFMSLIMMRWWGPYSLSQESLVLPFLVTVQQSQTPPLLTLLAASPNNSSALLEIVDCTSQMAIGGKKDATYLASVVRPYITAIEAHANTRRQKHQAVVDLVQYNGANNVQLSGRILARHHPCFPSLFSSKMYLNW